MKIVNIAIDGPSGAGKSTMAKLLAREFQLVYVDTGAMYRAIGLYIFRQGIDSKDRVRICAALSGICIDIRYADGLFRVILNGEDVSDLIRTNLISAYASDVSAIPEVRDFLFDLQRDLAKRQSVIMDGRDIGTVILPDADLKIFLTSSVDDRAKRRYEELLGRREQIEYDKVLSDISLRDRNDSTRQVAPLKPAPDAVHIDTSGNSIEQSFRILKELIVERLGNDL